MASTGGADAEPRRLRVAEPPPAYLVRPPAVVDASLAAAVLFAEPELDAARQRLQGHRAVAPQLLPYELANVAMNKLRRGSPAELVRDSLADLEALGLTLLPVDPLATFDLAARYHLSAYDAAYLALAAALRCPLLTFDQRLGDAAAAHLGALE